MDEMLAGLHGTHAFREFVISHRPGATIPAVRVTRVCAHEHTYVCLFVSKYNNIIHELACECRLLLCVLEILSAIISCYSYHYAPIAQRTEMFFFFCLYAVPEVHQC